MKRIFIFIPCILSHMAFSQVQDTSLHELNEVIITSYKAMNGVGHMKDDDKGIIYSGKKNEVLLIDSLDANKAINNTRQIIGRIPGVNIIETESGGFTANGIGFRGLNPYQSIETNTRQNGYNISADVFGYNEAYYLPPMEAVKSITFLRGASSLAFGPQIGGMINYELKEGAKKPIEVTASQTFGSYNMSNSFTSIGGTYKKIQYYGFVQYRYFGGWRENSEQNQLSGYAGIKYNANSKLQIGVEYTALRNTVRMPGGLTDSLFNVNPQQSLRSRNWLQSPWNILALSANYKISDNTTINFKSSFMLSQRDLVWRNEDGGPGAKDTITPDLNYVPREVEHEYFRNTTNELRFLTHYQIGAQTQALSFGVRFSYNFLKRQHGADGTTGSNLDYTTTSPWGGNMNFYNTNSAVFAEHLFRIGKRLSLTPGVRYEYLSSLANGYDENTDTNTASPYVISNMQLRTRNFIVGGLGIQFKAGENASFYANYSQSYKPITYDQLTPFGTIAKINPNLKDASADNIDLGFRGIFKNILNYDISIFYLNYKNRIGTVLVNSGTSIYPYRTNTGNSEHKGVESYIELNISNLLDANSNAGKLSVYNSYAYIYARYVSGEYAGNMVEYAPKNIDRVGLNYKVKDFSFNVQYSYTSSSFGDASNAKYSPDALIGIIPSYQLVDVSASYLIKNKYKIKCGVNNLTNEKYFTLRTSEYPGPGIIPSIGRMIYAGITATF
ncbi:MAG: TonB-dependent receptor [Bacteroidetes bacterium]|nr:TonB-dependent receptor [Bacteroidota bacterium]